MNAAAHPIQRLRKQRDTGAGKLRGKPGSRVELPHLRQGVLADRTTARRRSIKGVIVDDDEVAIGRLLHVELDEVRSESESALEGRQRVLGRLTQRSPVAARQRPSVAIFSTENQRR